MKSGALALRGSFNAAASVPRLVFLVSPTCTICVAGAQSAATGAIAGVARYATGAVLPGVTVEAASPALIEKVRTAVTDGQGNPAGPQTDATGPAGITVPSVSAWLPPSG